MRNLTLAIVLLFASGAMGYAQSLEESLKTLETPDTTLAQTKSAEPISAVDTTKSNIDTTRIRLGKRSIIIIDKGSTTSVEIPDKEDYRDWDITYKEKRKFKGHWAGVEFGINGYMNKNQSMIMKDDLAYMDLKQARSWNFNINFLQYNLGFGTDKAGIVTGMGIEFNNYHFSSETSLKNQNGITVVDSSYVDFNVTKSKLATTYFTIPLLLEFQVPAGHHRIHFSTGVIGGVRLGSHTKVVYKDGGKEKRKNRDDFNLSTFRYGLTARIGYRGLKLFANYYPTSLFEKDKGPELYPFTIGLTLIDF
ncbi:MAG: PorT family protein [Bacteroidales bacterium]|nr:PorT family protein [Bacteroidales bacterium]MBN2748305.1 PorT family protein [Bacteroidales bacterium]